MSGYRSSLWLGVFCLMYGLFFNYSTVINSILNGSRLRMEATIFLTLDVFLRLSILLIIFKLFDKSNISAITSYVVSIVVVLILQIISIKKYIFINSYDIEAIRKWTHKILRLSSPYIVLGPIVLIQSSSDRWAIGFFNNIESVGLYTVLYQLAYSPMVMIMNLVVKLIEPILYKTIESNNTTEYNKLTELTKKVLGYSFICTSIIFFITYCFHGFIFSIFVAPSYWAYSEFLPWLILVGGISGATSIIVITFFAELKTREIFIPNLLFSILGTILNFVGAYFAGVEGVLAALLLFSATQFFYFYRLGFHSNKNPFLNIYK